MKTKKILLYFFTLLATLTFIVITGLFFFYNEKEGALKQSLMVQQQNSLHLITEQVYGDLLIDNTMEADRKLNLLITKKVIESFKITKNEFVSANQSEQSCEVIYFDKENKQGLWGTICVRFSLEQLRAGTLNLKGVSTVVILLSIFFILVILYIFREISKMNNNLFQGVALAIKEPEKVMSENDLWEPVLSQLREEVTKKNNAETMLLKQKFDAEKIQIAHQVAHDIRSPLVALKMALEEVDNFPSDYRNMIRMSVQRINDIANNLLSDNREKSNQDMAQVETELLAPLVDSLVSEKRMNFRGNTGINIESDLTKSYGLFVKINSTELKRVLSNLINNSVEAMESSGKVIVSVSETADKKVLLSVSDNGKGMPEHIVKRLGEKGFSHGKAGLESGSGLGFYHAKETVESFGGNLKIESVPGQGTTINIFLPKADIPFWFVENLTISYEQKVLILDDDESMLRAWSERMPLQVDVFKSGEEFAKAVKELPSKDFLVLIDYELLGQAQTGLELIKSLKIEKQSILVTSRFEEKELRKRCNHLGVRLIPKLMMSLIPITYTASTVAAEAPYDYVYIDDEEIMRLVWERKAKKSNVSLLVLSSIKDFDQHLGKINKESTRIYIDSHFGENEMRGEDFAKILHEQGFKHLSIASGYEAKHFVHLDWLNYSGKDCPF